MKDDRILVIPKADVPRGHNHSGMLLREHVGNLLGNAVYIPRALAEESLMYKQVIPYVIILDHKGRVLTYQRSTKGGEDRLHSQYSLGFGGHVDYIDGGSPADAYMTGMVREMKEELGLTVQPKDFTYTGTISLEATPVDQVHIGLVHALVLDNLDLTKGELDVILERKFVSYNELEAMYDSLEVWSQIVQDTVGLLAFTQDVDTLKEDREALRQDMLNEG